MEPVEERSDVRSRLLHAPPAEVFAALGDPERLSRWWGPAGFRSTIHAFDFRVGGSWIHTMHGPDGTDYPNESRFTRIGQDEVWEIEHLSGHHFFLTIRLEAQGQDTLVHWRQTFDTAKHYQHIRSLIEVANEQNLERLAAEVEQGRSAPESRATR